MIFLWTNTFLCGHLITFDPLYHIITVLAPWKFSLSALFLLSMHNQRAVQQSILRSEAGLGWPQPARAAMETVIISVGRPLRASQTRPRWPMHPVSLCLEGSWSQSLFEDVEITDEGGRTSNLPAFAGVDVSPPPTLLSSFTVVSEHRNFLSLFEWWWVAGRDGRRRINTGWDAERFLRCVWRWEKVVWISLALAGCLQGRAVIKD